MTAGTGKPDKDPDPTVARLIDEAHQIQEQYADLMDRRDNTRTALRALSGSANDEQKAQIVELYPPRERKANTDTPVAKAA